MKAFMRKQCVHLGCHGEAELCEVDHVKWQCVGNASILAGARMFFEKHYPHHTSRSANVGHGKYSSKLSSTQRAEPFVIEKSGNAHAH